MIGSVTSKITHSCFLDCLANLGSACDDDSECTTENAICYKEYSSCSRGECTCELGYYRRQAGATCLLGEYYY